MLPCCLIWVDAHRWRAMPLSACFGWRLASVFLSFLTALTVVSALPVRSHQHEDAGSETTAESEHVWMSSRASVRSSVYVCGSPSAVWLLRFASRLSGHRDFTPWNILWIFSGRSQTRKAGRCWWDDLELFWNDATLISTGAASQLPTEGRNKDGGRRHLLNIYFN